MPERNIPKQEHKTSVIETSTTDAINSIEPSKPAGLLPTTSVNVARASNAGPLSSNFNAGVSQDMWAAPLAGHHDAEYYEKWNKERQEAVARGEDPNAKFLAKVEERKQQGLEGKVRRIWGRMKGGRDNGIGKHGEVEELAGSGDVKGDGVVR